MSEMDLGLAPEEAGRNSHRLRRGLPGKRSQRSCDSNAEMERQGVEEMEKDI